jgi:hypothetical protein
MSHSAAEGEEGESVSQGTKVWGEGDKTTGRKATNKQVRSKCWYEIMSYGNVKKIQRVLKKRQS